MSEIDLGLGVPGGGITPNEPIIPLQQPTTETQPQQLGDQLSSSSTAQNLDLKLFSPGSRILLQPPSTDPSYLQYLATISNTLSELKNVIDEIEIQDHLKSRELMASLAETAFALNELYSEISTHHTTWTSLRVKQNKDTKKLNDKIKAYNDHGGAEPWKTDLLNEVAIYNSKANNNNQIIELLNFQRENLGLELLDLQEYLVFPEGEPLPVPIDLLEAFKLPPNKMDWIETYFAPIYEALMAGIEFLMNQHELSEANIEVLHYFLRGRNVSLPNAFIDSIPKVFFSSEAGAAGGLNALTGISSPSLERSLGRELFLLSMNKLLVVLPQRTLDELELLTLQLMSKVGLSSTLPAANLLSSQLERLDPGSLPVKIALSLSFLSGIRSVIESNSISNIVRRLLQRQMQGLGFGRLAALTSSITASINLSLIGFGLMNTATALKVPGLIPNLLAIAPAIMKSRLSEVASETYGVSDVVGNAISRALLKTVLADNLKRFLFPMNVSQSLANGTVNHLSGPFHNSIADYRQTMYNEFRSQKLSRSQSRILANAGIKFLRDEAQFPFLDTSYNPLSVNRNSLVNNLADVLIRRGHNRQVFEGAISQAVNEVLGNSYDSLRKFRDELRNELLSQGMGHFHARLISNQAAQFIDESVAAPPSKDPLAGLGLNGTLEVAALMEAISEKVLSNLTPHVGVSVSQNIANELTTLLVGVSTKEIEDEEMKRPNSLINIINDQIETLRTYDERIADDAIYDMFRDFIHIKPEIYALNKRLMRPADTEFDSLLGESSSKRDIMFLGGV